MSAEAVVPESPLRFLVEVREGVTVVHCSGQLMAAATDALRMEVKGLNTESTMCKCHD